MTCCSKDLNDSCTSKEAKAGSEVADQAGAKEVAGRSSLPVNEHKTLHCISGRQSERDD